ncbi:MAG: hypothetical protein FWF71_07930 [Actinomycetia bacterium]|nr:hypothetical protein [Actinomycetes bacterium]
MNEGKFFYNIMINKNGSPKAVTNDLEMMLKAYEFSVNGDIADNNKNNSVEQAYKDHYEYGDNGQITWYNISKKIDNTTDAILTYKMNTSPHLTQN